MDIFESEHSDIAWNKWNFRLFETTCHALAINYFRFGHIWVRTFRYIAWNKWNFRLFETKCHALAIHYFRLDIFESEHSDITWNKWNFRLFETKFHALDINYFRFGHIWVRTFRYIAWNKWNFRLTQHVMH